MPISIAEFNSRWLGSVAAERANKDLFLSELCDLLGVDRPKPATGDLDRDTYVFERDVRLVQEDGASVGRIDLYKEGCFILEAKQGSEDDSKKIGTAKRGKPRWQVAMGDAYGQAFGYARTFENPPPFIITCDIGYCLDLYAAFDGTTNYHPFPDAQHQRVFLRDLSETHVSVLRCVFETPRSLDPSIHAAKVTREVAGHLADLSKSLGAAGNAPEVVAQFLMRCIFTMFAEDVGLLPQRSFTNLIKERWLPSPQSFPGGIEALWYRMNEGGPDSLLGKVLRFNGGLFKNPTALPLDRQQLQLLLNAANCEWSDVEPAIFGTLLERALDPKKRHALGAHFTPRAYVERLVRPAIEEPLQADWDAVCVEVRKLVIGGQEEEARKKIRLFHERLCNTRVLDPACGSGNFLYVALDVFKRLESKVREQLAALGARQEGLWEKSVTPAQFLGIEKERWAKEIAELVLWIGYIQWHFRAAGKSAPISEPVLQDYGNIECRDAVLAWEGEPELVRDEKTGKPVTRWDGETMKPSPVTGESVPDLDAQLPIYWHRNPKKAGWPEADFIIGNPPFIANRNMRLVLGDAYAEAIRRIYDEVPDTADYVMYWWSTAAGWVGSGKVRMAGLITTNTISQTMNRGVVARALNNGVQIHFAIPDHPWEDGDAAVRVAMTAFRRAGNGSVTKYVVEASTDGAAVALTGGPVHCINSDLSSGVDVTRPVKLRANLGLSNLGVALHAKNLALSPQQAAQLHCECEEANVDASPFVRPTLNGRDLAQTPRGAFVLDLFGVAEAELLSLGPIYQWLVDRVLPERQQNPRAAYRKNWWLCGEARAELRPALRGLSRMIVTTLSSRHRVFQFIGHKILPDQALVVFAFDDALMIGLLSGRIHVVWALAAGGRLGVGNDPRYLKARCFDPFPFPVCNDAQKKGIRELGEQIDAHRKRQQSQHPDLTITSMYNVLAKLRSGEALTAKDKVIHEQGLVSVLRKIHDDLDVAVFDAYGWPRDLTDEQILERLVALNAERVEEERQGLVRWLRPEFQNPSGVKKQVQTEVTVESGESKQTKPVGKVWPKNFAEQVVAVRSLIESTGVGGWTSDQVAVTFKGADKQKVLDVLEGLAALGIVLSYEAEGATRWRSARDSTSPKRISVLP